MSAVLVTCDTELSPALHQLGWSATRNFESSILGRCPAGDFGVGWQMDRLDAHGHKGVFFVDPLAGLVCGPQVIADTVGLITARGHEVQLHIHTEWLQWAAHSPVDGRTGTSIADFSAEDQLVLLGLAADLLVEAGAPRPIAFRAGNYGADDRTLDALAALGIAWDSSFNGSYSSGACRIGLPADTRLPLRRRGMSEVPVSAVADRPGRLRPAQVCALSSREMEAGLRHAAAHREPVFTIVTHSFEMLSRDRSRPNRLVMMRFEQMCRTIECDPELRCATFGELDAAITQPRPAAWPPTPDVLRTGARMVEQLVGTWLYERRLRPY